MTRRGFLFAAGACACAWGQAVQTQSEIRGKKIVDDALAALGGNTFLSMADRTEIGRAYSYYHDQISGLSVAKIYTRYRTVEPAKSSAELGQIEREVFGKTEDTSVLFLEDAGWDISWRGNKPMEQERFDRYRESTLRNVLYIFRQRLHEPGMIFEAQGSEVVENLPVDIVNITDSDNHVVRVQFHQSTKLPVRQIYKRKNAVTKEQDEEVTLFARYRDAGGVQWPHQIRRERNGDKVYEIFSESVAINKDLAGNLFTLPESPGVKPKKK
ncbi:MAG: hypothetical protein ABSF12_11035 [Bryobacteraceae bacterium]|jgi:hypothetical protein